MKKAKEQCVTGNIYCQLFAWHDNLFICRNCLPDTHLANYQNQPLGLTDKGKKKKNAGFARQICAGIQQKLVNCLICEVEHQSLVKISHQLWGQVGEDVRRNIHTLKNILSKCKDWLLLRKEPSRQIPAPYTPATTTRFLLLAPPLQRIWSQHYQQHVAQEREGWAFTSHLPNWPQSSSFSV